jgi:DNA repair exonuclease SbcCD ATPase subunit
VAAHQAGRRKELEEQLRIRIQLEQTAADAVDRARTADENLGRAADRCGVQGTDLRETAAALQSWLEQKGKDRERLHQDMQKWRALQSTLGGLSIEEFERETDTRAKKAKEMAAKFRLEEVRALMASETDLVNLVASLQKELTDTSGTLALALGRISERERTLASVSETEEEVEAARLERDRLESLKQTLETARSFLERAQEQAHRSIAPALREAVGRRLPDVTAGRYWDVRVDPESLAVQVCGANGKWRDASGLSHGTAEQIFLLLRVALAEHLVRPGEVCPLLLDDITVHSDVERTQAVLACLQAISRERQVILFSQQEAVLSWAQENLAAPSGRLIRLDAGEVGV